MVNIRKSTILWGFAICFGLIYFSSGCNYNKIITKNIPSQNINIEKNTDLAAFEEKYSDTVEIDISFNPDGMYREFNSIKIKDRKIISDILKMIGKSELLSDESKIQRLSGMAEKNNKLILMKQDGSQKEIIFTFDDPASAIGFLDIDGKKYDTGYDFFRYIRGFTEYKKFDTNIDNMVVQLFKKYNWTVDYRANIVKETLPVNFKHEVSEYPTKIYWAYNNELSKSIGLDFSGYLGKDVDAEIYSLREPLPDYMKPRKDARGIVIKYDGKIIGAYIDAGRHSCFGCSLDRKNIKDITNKDWNNWVSDYIDYNDEIQIKLSKMSPEEIIKQYYQALDKQDERMWAACMTREELCSYLTLNMDLNKLINKDFREARFGNESYIKNVKLIKIQKIDYMDNPKDIVEYEATVDMTVQEFATCESGIQSRFLILKKESEKSGWRISSDGTGP